MKQIEVVAAVIYDDSERILSTQRGYGEMRGGWEFPGGKIEVGESHAEALRRELREELSVEITVGQHLITIDYDYPTFHLTMHCYRCRIATGQPTLKEHLAQRWLSKAELDTVAWLPADIAVVEMLKN